MLASERRRIAELAVAMRLPTIGSQNSDAEAGGSSAMEWTISRILKGTKPADLPVEFPTKLVTIIIDSPAAHEASPVRVSEERGQSHAFFGDQ